MKDIFKKVFGAAREDADQPDAPRQEASGHDVRIATCALFLEIANIDNEFSDEERHSIIDILQSEFDLSEQHAEELAAEAARELKGSIDLWQFTNSINDNFTDEEKMRVVELLWRVVYADGKLDAHEDFLVHKLAKLLRLQHKQLIQCKLRVLHGQSD